MQRRPNVRKYMLPLGAFLVLVIGAGCTGAISGSDPRHSDEGKDGFDVPSGPAAKSACGGTPTASVGAWRRLTAKQYERTVRDLLGHSAEVSSFLPDSMTGPFKTNSVRPVQEGDVGNYASTAVEIANKAVADIKTILDGCDTGSDGEDKCAARFVNQFGARAFRHPLTDDEEAALLAVYEAGKQESFSTGIRLVIQAVLQAPSFLYLVERGREDPSGLRKLTGYEMATRLSYLFTGSMPDAELFAAAKDGKLETSQGIRAAAEKLLASPAFVGQVADFHAELLGVEDLTDTTVVTKAPKFSSFDVPMRKAMLDEQRQFVEHVMTKGSGSVEEIFSGNYVFPIGRLSEVYGTEIKAAGDGMALVNDGTRKGILTLGANLAVHPKQFSPSAAVSRGHFVRRELLCQPIPPPQEAVDFSPPPGAEKMTAQELLRVHQENPTCFACHRLMDSIGFAFESYDAVGAYRTKDDAGNNIDPSGEIVELKSDGRFSNAGEMADVLAKSTEVRSCMSTQWFRFALGREPDDADACTQDRVQAALSAGKGDIREAILSLVTSDSFRLNGGQ